MKVFKALRKELKRELKGIGKGVKSIIKPQTLEVDGDTLFIVDFKAKMHEKDGYKKSRRSATILRKRNNKISLVNDFGGKIK